LTRVPFGELGGLASGRHHLIRDTGFDLAGYPLLDDERHERDTRAQEDQTDARERPADLEAEVRRRRDENHEDEAVDRAPPREDVVVEAVLQDHLGDEDEHRDTGRDGGPLEEGQRSRDGLGVGDSGTHTCSFCWSGSWSTSLSWMASPAPASRPSRGPGPSREASSPRPPWPWASSQI